MNICWKEPYEVIKNMKCKIGGLFGPEDSLVHKHDLKCSLPLLCVNYKSLMQHKYLKHCKMRSMYDYIDILIEIRQFHLKFTHLRTIPIGPASNCLAKGISYYAHCSARSIIS